jgi:hypothetical protein
LNLREKLISSGFKSQEMIIDEIGYIVKEMNAKDATEYEASLYKMVDGKPILTLGNSKSRLVQKTLHDKEGNRIFEEKDIELVNKMPASLVNKIFEIASDLNGIKTARKN